MDQNKEELEVSLVNLASEFLSLENRIKAKEEDISILGKELVELKDLKIRHLDRIQAHMCMSVMYVKLRGDIFKLAYNNGDFSMYKIEIITQ